LYLEQIAAMLAEGGSPDTIPPSIHALIAARLDRLPHDERALLEHAAVAGKEFTRAALRRLSLDGDPPDMDALLLRLARKDLLAAVTLLERATALLPEADPARGELLLELSRSQREAGQLAEADESLRVAAELADAAADRLLGCRILLDQALLHAYTYPERGTEE